MLAVIALRASGVRQSRVLAAEKVMTTALERRLAELKQRVARLEQQLDAPSRGLKAPNARRAEMLNSIRDDNKLAASDDTEDAMGQRAEELFDGLLAMNPPRLISYSRSERGHSWLDRFIALVIGLFAQANFIWVGRQLPLSGRSIGAPPTRAISDRGHSSSAMRDARRSKWLDRHYITGEIYGRLDLLRN